MMTMWIDEFEEATHYAIDSALINEIAEAEMIDERCICTFCDEPGVSVRLFGAYKVHLCEAHDNE